MTDSSRFTDATSLSLLDRTQQYLRALIEQRVPDSMLQESWDLFYNTYNRLIERFIISRGVRRDDVDDCLQEVWSEVANRLVNFERPADRPGLRSWLYTLVRSKATDIVRRKIKQGVVGIGESTAAKIEPDSREHDPAEECEQQWNDALVHTMLDDLKGEVSELNYNVLYLRFIEGRSVSEVADTLSIKPEQVRYRQHRMLKKLQNRQSLFTGAPIGKLD